METLSFSCPNCNKVYSRVKPEMVGNKVRCACGFVFRLGTKNEKNDEFAKTLKQRLAAKERKSEMHRKSNAGLSAPSNSNRLDDLDLSREPAMQDELFAPNSPPASSHHSTSQSESTPAGSASPTAFDDLQVESFQTNSAKHTNNPMVELLDEALPDEVNERVERGFFPPPKAPRSERSQKTVIEEGDELESWGGPIWAILLSLVALLPLGSTIGKFVFLAVDSVQRAFDRGAAGTAEIAEMIATGFLTLCFLALLISTFVLIGISVTEIVQSRRIRWSSRLTAVLAATCIMSVCLYFILTCFTAIEIANDPDDPIGAPIAAGLTIGKFGLCFSVSITPLALAITSFIRS
jgi:hypothetical protein